MRCMSLKGLAAGNPRMATPRESSVKVKFLIDVGLVSMTCRAVCISLALMAVPSKRSA